MLNCKDGFRSIFITLVLLLLTMAFPHTALADTVNSTYNTNENGIIITDNNGNDSSSTVLGVTVGQAEAGNSIGLADASLETDHSVTGITLDKTSAVLMVGESLSIVPTISPAGADNKNVIWTSSNTAAVIVDQTGLVSAISEGAAIITATTEDGSYIAACDINVSHLLAVPGNELATAINYDIIKIRWSQVMDASGYEVYRSDAIDGVYHKIAEMQSTEYSDTGLKAGTGYYYKVRAYKTIFNTKFYSNDTPVITAKTLDYSIGSSLFLYMSDLMNRNSVFQKAVVLHNGDPHNTCALTVSEALRRINLNIPVSTCRTNQVEDYLAARGWKREMNLKLLQPGDICFTTDAYGNFLGGHSTHTFIFMGWADKEKTLMNICDNQIYTYGSVLHTRTIFRSKLTDATAFFYHTNATGAASILKITKAVQVASVSYNKVKISWSAAVGANGYNIYRATSKYGTYKIIAATGNTYYTNSGLITGKTYYYKIKAYNKRGTSKIYGSNSAIYAATPAFSVPVSYSKSTSKGKVNLSWKGVSGASGYQIYRSTAKSGTYIHIGSTSSTSYTNSGLVSGKTYYYKVRAYRYTGRTVLYSAYAYSNLYVL